MRKRSLIVQSRPKSPVAEAFRTLRSNIQFSNIDRNIKTIVFTSAGPGEGKTTVCSNYVVTLSQNRKKVLLIDTDLRKPKIHNTFDLSNEDGLSDYIVDVDSFEYKDIIKKTKFENIDIITSGAIPPNPSELLSSKKMEKLLSEVINNYDYVIIDSPPLNYVTDAAIVSHISDGTVLICSVGKTKKGELLNAHNLLKKANANILGVVFNKIPLKNSRYRYYSQYGYY